MNDKEITKNEKKENLDEYYGLEPEMSLQNVKFATTDNNLLNEYGDNEKNN